MEHHYSHHAAHRTWQNDDANAHVKVTLISQSKSQGERRGINVLFDTKTLEKCVTEGLKLSNQVLIPDSKDMHSSSHAVLVQVKLRIGTFCEPFAGLGSE